MHSYYCLCQSELRHLIKEVHLWYIRGIPLVYLMVIGLVLRKSTTLITQRKLEWWALKQNRFKSNLHPFKSYMLWDFIILQDSTNVNSAHEKNV